jgi:lysophospholipase L1-like esterase
LVPAAALALFLPLSLSVADTVFFQCVDGEGRVYFRYNKPEGEERCLLLGTREERKAVDDKVRNFFADNDGSRPGLGGNVVGNGEKGLRSFNAKLKALADPVTIYFVGDSHLQSGDFIRGVLDGFAPEHRVDGADLCVHKVKNGTKKKGRRRASARLPKDYPLGVPRACGPLDEQEETGDAPALARTDADNGTPGRTPVRVRGYGISGKTFDYFSGSLLLERDLREMRPDLVVAMLGTNDAFARPEQEAVRRDIMKFLQIVRRASPESEIVFITPPDSCFKDGSTNNYIAAVGRELRATAAEQGTAFWDLYSVMGGQGSMEKWRKRGLSQKDRIHFLADGYVLLGRLFSQALMRAGTGAGL